MRGGGFTVVTFDRLPQGLLILYGTLSLSSCLMLYVLMSLFSFHDGKGYNTIARQIYEINNVRFSIFRLFQCQPLSGISSLKLSN